MRKGIYLVALASVISSCEDIHEIQKISYTQNIYAKVNKKGTESFDTTLNVPVLNLSSQYQAEQKKGDVTISCQMMPINIDSSVSTDKNYRLVYADPSHPGFDQYEVYNSPASYWLNTGSSNAKVLFNINIRNDQDRILKLNDVAVVTIVDGNQYSLPDDNMIEWKQGMILKDFAKNFKIQGPLLSGLSGAKTIRVSINDVPILYDSAGNILKKENFDWVYDCSSLAIPVQSPVTYNYVFEPVETQQCSACNGIGYFTQQYQCSLCSGTGTMGYVYGVAIKCSKCNGTGIITTKTTCATCGGKGKLYYPKSQPPPVDSTATWSGWEVSVKTDPPGAKISSINRYSGLYYDIGVSPAIINWFGSCNQLDKEFPIIVSYGNKTVKLLPYDRKGTPISAIQITFTGSEPQVIHGKIAADQ